MAIAFVDAHTASQASGSILTLVPPTGVAAGDILIALVRAYAASVTINAPDVNWTQIATQCPIDGSASRRASIFWKRATASETDYVFDLVIAGSEAGGCVGAFSGCITSGDPVDVYSSVAYTTSNTTVRAASVTTTVANTMLVAIAASGVMGDTFTPPSGMDERTDASVNQAISMATAIQSAVGASGDKDFTESSTLTNKHAFLIALKSSAPTLTAEQVGADIVVEWA